MSLFNGSKAFVVLSAATAKPLDPAAEVARLLNQHTSTWMALEKEIKEVKGKQEAAQGSYAATLEAREAARQKLIDTEAALMGLEAEAAHVRAEVESNQAANSKLMEEVEVLKQEFAGVTSVADQARHAFTEQVAALMAELKQMREAHPNSFMALHTAQQ